MKLLKPYRLIAAEVGGTIRRPWRVANLLHPQKLTEKYRFYRHSHAVPFRTVSEGPFKHRLYPTYEDYRKHQASKIAVIGDAPALHRMEVVLPPRISRAGLKRASAVLCLGARSGSECRAFIGAGHFAVGIDLNPGPDNCWVTHGDFHNLQFADESIDVIYSNSLDHALDLERVAEEAHRVLKCDGILWLEIALGPEDAEGIRELHSEDYESLHWQSAHDVAGIFENRGFTIERSEPFNDRWAGLWVLMRKRKVQVQSSNN